MIRMWSEIGECRIHEPGFVRYICISMRMVRIVVVGFVLLPGAEIAGVLYFRIAPPCSLLSILYCRDLGVSSDQVMISLYLFQASSFEEWSRCTNPESFHYVLARNILSLASFSSACDLTGEGTCRWAALFVTAVILRFAIPPVSVWLEPFDEMGDLVPLLT